MNNAYKIFLLLMLFLPILTVDAETRLEIKKDVIQGNSELPKVLYIIPWKINSSKAPIQGVKLENFYEKLLKPYHPHKIIVNNAK